MDILAIRFLRGRKFLVPSQWGVKFCPPFDKKKEGTRHFSVYLLNEKEVRFRDLTVLYNIFTHIASIRFLIYYRVYEISCRGTYFVSMVIHCKVIRLTRNILINVVMRLLPNCKVECLAFIF